MYNLIEQSTECQFQLAPAAIKRQRSTIRRLILGIECVLLPKLLHFISFQWMQKIFRQRRLAFSERNDLWIIVGQIFLSCQLPHGPQPGYFALVVSLNESH